jgi:Protein of unknown function (DUF2789)
MDSTFHSMTELFDPLGLPSDEASNARFIGAHFPLVVTTRFYDAPLGSPAQAAFIKEKMRDDGDSVSVIDSLNTRLRAHPDTSAAQ